MEIAKGLFDKRFRSWGIELPAKDLRARRRGKICRNGRAIWYLFGHDENGEYLDYYASHRMTDDSHIRVYSDGATVDLPAIQGMRIVSDDPEILEQYSKDYSSVQPRRPSCVTSPKTRRKYS